MGHRTFVMFGCVAMMFASQVAFALGLGDITLRSSLNQPLVAEIRLLEVGDLTEAEILAGLASQEDFERVGVDRPFFLSDLRYEVRLGTPRGNLIVVTSRKPVREPYLNFIVQVRWPSGRMLREYTVLMDLPVFSDQATGAVAPAQSGSEGNFSEEPERLAGSDRIEPSSSFDEQPSTQSDFSSDNLSAAGAGTYGPVRSNDTLWDIAAQARPDSNTSIQQTMIAIQSLNPRAFINNNINLLKQGQVLRLPDRDQIRDISLQQANARVAQQNSEWTGNAASNQAQLDARNFSSSGVDDIDEFEGRVKLSSPDNAFGSNEGRGSGAADSSTEALENELATTLEQLDKSNRENSELRSKIESLEEQILTMERMVEVSNEDLRALELSIEKTKQQNAELSDQDAQLADDIAQDISDTLEEDLQNDARVEDDFARVDDDDIGSRDDADLAVDETQLAGSIADDLVDSADSEAGIQEIGASTGTASNFGGSAAEPRGFVGMLMDNIIFVLGGVFALAAVAFFSINYLRANRDEELDDDELPQMPAFDEPLVAQETADEEASAGFEDIDDVFPDDEEDEELFEEDPAESQTGDVASEAEIYIAYGKYEQATEMLHKALVDQPDRPELHLKLLEVYANEQNIEAFDPQFAKLLALDSEEASERGHQLRSTISGVSEYGASDLNEDGFASDELLIPGEDDEKTVYIQEQGAEDLDLGADLTDVDDLEDFDLETDLAGDLEGDLDLELGLDADEPTDLEHELDLGMELSASDEDDEATVTSDLDLGDFDADGFGSESERDLHLNLEGDDVNKVDLSNEDSAAQHDLEKELGLDFGLDLANESPAVEDHLTRELAEQAEADNLDFDLGLDDDNNLSKNLDNDLAALDAALGEGASGADVSPSDARNGLDTVEGDVETAGLNGIEAKLQNGDASAHADDEVDFDISGLDDLDSDLSASSEDEIDEFLDLSFPEDEPEANGAANGGLDDFELGEDLDLSSLDSELDELASELSLNDDLQASSEGKSKQDDDLLAGLEDLDLGDDPGSSADKQADPFASDEVSTKGNGEDGMFDEALSGVPDANLDFEIPEVDPDSLDDDGELDFLNDSDETATKLDLARAYIDMGDEEGAKDILAEIRAEGSEAQRLEADRLSQRLS